MSGLVSCFKKIEETQGMHTHIQIIIFTDYNELNEMFFKIRPPFPVKLHVFSMAKSHHVLKHIPITSTIESSTATPSESTKSSDISTNTNNLKQLTKLYTGHCYFLIPTTKNNIDESILSEFIKKCYDKYSGYLVFGHLVSPIELHPDPNLVMWLLDRQHDGIHPSASMLESSSCSANERQCHVPPILNIVGFIPGTELSSPKCISKHTILPLNADDNEVPYGVRMSRRDKEIQFGKFKKIVKADACKADEAPASFYQLLHMTLSKSRSLDIPPPPVNSEIEETQNQNEAKRICAIVSLGGIPERFAYVTACNDGELSSLVLGIFNEELEFSVSEEYCRNIPKTQLAHNNLAYPWLETGVGQMVEEMSIANAKDIEKTGEQFDLFSKCTNLKTYNYDLKQTKNVIVPFQKVETLSNDFGKIIRNIKNLPKKTDLVTNECEKLRYISQVFHNSSIIDTLKQLLEESIEKNKEKVKTEQSTEAQEQLLRSNRILRIIIEQLEKNPKAKLKPPKGEHLFESVSQELATIKHQHYEQMQHQVHPQQQMPIHTAHHVVPQHHYMVPMPADSSPHVMPQYPYAAQPLPYESGYPLPIQQAPQVPYPYHSHAHPPPTAHYAQYDQHYMGQANQIPMDPHQQHAPPHKKQKQ
ncbi:predicted protein [Naegleria gruberi]|uniref:Predicted protein n=1 Tax=Naegleria gruberi TaxID=5762 RepID=D2V550_NAEGR|nr:uncharacterized protein NAEGRDRAFT_46786 [Naegleria gruberi]EFC48049.1 predicted protein [Naegleria gruberi]|eukprot:XP_002680793.1 predicted protein [Naegleria gruberi strain NEG-M]